MSEEWDDLPDIQDPSSGGKGPKQSIILFELCEKKGVEHFRDLDTGETLVVFPRNGHRELSDIGSDSVFRNWLTLTLFESGGGIFGESAFEELSRLLKAKAHGKPKVRTYVRVAHADGKVYVDLSNDQWQVIEIGPEGWQVIDDSPVLFRRSDTTHELPKPVHGGSLAEIKRIINVKKGDSFTLLAAWLLAATNQDRPFPVLVVRGEHGTGKSRCVAYLKRILDPETAELRSVPTKQDDLFPAAANHLIVAFDNLSGAKADVSDWFCRLSTGEAISKRRLYTDNAEFVLAVKRALALNGIGLSIDRPDLLSRTFCVELSPIAESERKTERELDERFREAHPRLLGALCDAINAALRERGYRPAKLPRMADSGEWILQAERGGGLPWPEGTFREALARTTVEAEEEALSENPLAGLIIELARFGWSGTMAELQRRLLDSVPMEERKFVPQTARALSPAIDRLRPLLRTRGVEIVKRRHSIEIHRGGMQEENIGNIRESNVHAVNDDDDWTEEHWNVENIETKVAANTINPSPIVEQDHAADSDSLLALPEVFKRSHCSDVTNVSDVKVSDERSRFALPEPPFLARGHWGQAWVDSVEFDENGEAWFIFGQDDGEKRQERANESEVKIGSQWTDAA